MRIGSLEIHPLWVVIAACAWTGYAITELSGGPGHLSTIGQIVTIVLVVVIAVCTSIIWKWQKRR